MVESVPSAKKAERVLNRAGLRDEEISFMWLTRALEHRAVGLTYLGVDPHFDFMRGDEKMKFLTWRLDQEFGNGD